MFGHGFRVRVILFHAALKELQLNLLTELCVMAPPRFIKAFMALSHLSTEKPQTPIFPRESKINLGQKLNSENRTYPWSILITV